MRRNLFHCSNSQQGATDKVTLLFGITIFFKFLLFDFIWSIIRKSKFPQNPKRSVRFSGKRTKRSVQKRKARNTQKAETKVL